MKRHSILAALAIAGSSANAATVNHNGADYLVWNAAPIQIDVADLSGDVTLNLYYEDAPCAEFVNCYVTTGPDLSVNGATSVVEYLQAPRLGFYAQYTASADAIFGTSTATTALQKTEYVYWEIVGEALLFLSDDSIVGNQPYNPNDVYYGRVWGEFPYDVSIEFSYTPSATPVSPVPVPGALGLLAGALGIMGLSGLAGRRRTTA